MGRSCLWALMEFDILFSLFVEWPERFDWRVRDEKGELGLLGLRCGQKLLSLFVNCKVQGEIGELEVRREKGNHLVGLELKLAP